jgi:hypothetical protein
MDSITVNARVISVIRWRVFQVGGVIETFQILELSVIGNLSIRAPF